MRTFHRELQEYELSMDLRDALRVLSDLERDLVLLRCYEEVSFTTIQEMYNEHNTAVYPKQLYDALDKLSLYLSGEKRKKCTLKRSLGVHPRYS